MIANAIGSWSGMSLMASANSEAGFMDSLPDPMKLQLPVVAFVIVLLILLFLYLGHMALANAFDDPVRGAKASAILALAGVVNVPIIKFSVDWWNTLHQPASVTRVGLPAIDPAMLVPLLLMALLAMGAAALLRRKK